MSESDIRDADSYEDFKGYSPAELREEKSRVESELAQVERTLDRVKHSLKLRERDASNPLTGNYSDPEWSPRRKGFRAAEEVIDETKRARQDELRERKRLINRVLGEWKAGQIELPTESNPGDEIPTEKAHTVAIGEWLLEYYDRHGETPDFQDSKGNFKNEAAKVIGDEGKPMSKATVYNALSATGCWDEDPKQGDSSGLDAILNRTMDYAEDHGDAPKRSQDED